MLSIQTMHLWFATRVSGQKIAFVTVAMMFGLQPPVFADIVYSLNNYPSVQDGGSLSGSIIVSDNAPDDGVLTETEILAWE